MTLNHTHVATIHTNHGDIKLNLFADEAPVTVQNFIDLANGTKTGKPFYDGVIFHRIISGFMIQGGDPTGTGMGGPGYTFHDEPHAERHFKEPYMLAMANAGPSTNGSQFFITVAPTQYLHGRHTVFGEVADEDSRQVVDKISNVPTGAGDRPVNPVVIESISFDA